MRRALFGCALLALSIEGFAQADSLQAHWKVYGYVEVYFAHRFGGERGRAAPAFVYQYDQQDAVDLNLGLLHTTYTRDHVRAAFGLMTGTYAQANLIAEPELLRNVNEARVGLRLSKKRQIWLDAGVFTSHIGMESAIGIDNFTLTRTVMAENSPYYLSGARLTWTVSPKLEVAALFVNGWQRIRRVQDDIPCFGTQVLWTIREGMQFNWSTFAGSDVPDSLGYHRLFNNLWWSWDGDHWGVQLGFDAGMQEDGLGAWISWAGAVGIVRRRLGERYHIVGRTEYYTDPDQVMVPTGTPHGLTLLGYSLGMDLKVAEDAYVRLEGRTFHGVDAVFNDVHGSTQDNTAITVSTAVRF